MYVFNGQNLNYIWFGPLLLENRARLKRVRSEHPEARITLTISERILTKRDYLSIRWFCLKNSIRLHTFEALNREVSESKNENEKKLCEIINLELTLPYGNKAAASDILRTISRFWKGSGVYLDLDTRLGKSPLKEENHIKEKFLLPIVGVQNDAYAAFEGSNDVIIMATTKKEHCIPELEETLKYIQKNIIDNYENPIKKTNPLDFDGNGHLKPLFLTSNNIFEIRKQILEMDFDAWKKTLFENFIRQVCSQSPKYTPLLNPKNKDSDKNNEYNLLFQDLEKIILRCLKENFISIPRMIKLQHPEIENPDITLDKALKNFHQMNIHTLIWSIVPIFSGYANWQPSDPNQISSFLQNRSLYYHGFGTQYIGQLGSHEGLAVEPEYEVSADNSWSPNGSFCSFKRNEKIAMEILKKNRENFKKFSASVKHKKTHPFTIRHWNYAAPLTDSCQHQKPTSMNREERRPRSPSPSNGM